MNIESIHRFSDKITPASEHDLKALERAIGALPLGYRDFMTYLGDGVYFDVIDVLMPNEVLAATKDRKRWLAECYQELPPEHQAVLPQDQVATRGFVFGFMNPNGPYRSELWHVPGAAHPLYVLTPFHDELYWVEDGFFDPLNWVSVKGPWGVAQGVKRFFEPKKHRATVALDHFQPTTVEAVRDRMLKLLPDCETHSTRANGAGKLHSWTSLSKQIGGRVSVFSHIQPFEDVTATLVDAQVEEDESGAAIAGVDLTIDYDRDASKFIDGMLSALTAEGFTIRFKRNR